MASTLSKKNKANCAPPCRTNFAAKGKTIFLTWRLALLVIKPTLLGNNTLLI